MAVYEFEGKKPKLGVGCFIMESASVIGNVELGPNCYVGPGASIRGDYGKIIIGEGTCIEDNCTVHARPDDVCTVGNNVTIGHNAVIHNCTIEDYAIIGMGAIVSDWAIVRRWAVVAEGAVVKNRQEIPERSIAVGVPAKVIGQVNEEFIKQWDYYKATYAELASRRYPAGLKRIL